MSGNGTVRHRIDGDLYLRERRPRRPRGTLLYIHGLGESGLGFERLLAEPRLGEWHHLAIDLPGYGKSPWLANGTGYSDFAARAELLEAFLATRDPGPLVVLGHSMGGVLGTLLCERLGREGAPLEARALVNVEGNISFEDCTASHDVARQSLDAFLAGGVDALRDDVYRKGLDQPGFRNYFASLSLCDPRMLHRDSVELVALSREETLARRMAALELPCRYLLGHPRGTGRHSQTLLDHAGVPWRAIPNAGHWVFLDQHDAFVDQLADFLEELS